MQVETKRGMRLHELKSWPDAFFEVGRGHKTAEFRRNDRDFKRDDLILLREYIPTELEAIGLGMGDDWKQGYWVDWTAKSGAPENEEERTDDDYDYKPSVELPCYTGDTELMQITHIQEEGFGIPEGYVMLSVRRISLK